MKKFPLHPVDAGGSRETIRLLLTDREVKLIAQNPERFMEEIEVRATRMSSLLETFLREPREPHWGLND